MNLKPIDWIGVVWDHDGQTRYAYFTDKQTAKDYALVLEAAGLSPLVRPAYHSIAVDVTGTLLAK